MAVNPMQRKARQSFLLGMLLMLLIAAIVVGILFMQLMNYKNEKDATEAASKTVYVLKNDIKSGEEISAANLEKKSLVTTLANNEILSPANLSENSLAKIDLGKGTILTQSMVIEEEQADDDSLRTQEFNMITLPTDLETNDYIDIRLLFPNGQDFIVVSKKMVVKSSENTILLKLSESEILTMSNAIVESYITEGSMLYATKYTDAGIQAAATPTYAVSKEVLDLIDSNANITQTAKNALYSKYVQNNRTQIDTVLRDNLDDSATKVNDKLDEQIRKAQEERSKYLENLGSSGYLE